MYEFVDRKLESLNGNGRLLLHAMRLWVSSAAEGQCCCTQLQTLFKDKGHEQGMPCFGLLMQCLQRGARRNISFLPPACGKVGEDEAVLLALIRLGQQGAVPRHSAAQALVTGAYLGPFLQSVEALAGALHCKGGMPALEQDARLPRAREA